jgi:hypothetical protein
MPGNVNINIPPRLIESARAAQYANREALDGRALVSKIKAKAKTQRAAAVQAKPPLTAPVGGLLEERRRPVAWRIWRRRNPVTSYVKSLKIEYVWTSGRDLDTVTSMTAPVTDGPLGWAANRVAKYISWQGDDTTDNGIEVITLGRPKLEEGFIPESKNIDNFLRDNPNADVVKFSLAANWYGSRGSEVLIRVKINVGEQDEAIIFEEIVIVTLYQQGGPGQNLGILEVSLDGSDARFV